MQADTYEERHAWYKRKQNVCLILVERFFLKFGYLSLDFYSTTKTLPETMAVGITNCPNKSISLVILLRYRDSIRIYVQW